MCAIACQSRSKASSRSSSGKTSPAQPGEGAGATHQFVVARLTTSPVFGRYGRMSRPAREGSIPSSASGDAGPLSAIRAALVRQPLEPLRHPRGDVVERRSVGMEQALALQPGIEDRDVDPARAALVRRAGHLARQRLLADVGRDTDDLARLDVRAVADDQVGEAARGSACSGTRGRVAAREWPRAPRTPTSPCRHRVPPRGRRADQGGARHRQRRARRAEHVRPGDRRRARRRPRGRSPGAAPRAAQQAARDDHDRARPRRRPTVVDLVKGDVRVVPVGRLDRDTTGVLLLTNDGPLAHRLAHPRYGIEKTYVAEVRGEPSDETLARLAVGVELEDGPTAPPGPRLGPSRRARPPRGP